ncbi:protoporphyrin IX magnesium chelatase [Glycocaulis alkaliphilus]|uniref:Protoporphyrin IX magnesium chelatase n=1 Tax=Glycocaulis alkaliphilus TaxID=1434191 RepID=A0A3T0E8E6_9PROT|nr:cobaltochelatase subunit CobN [Glycocaulis alkaliphilus]AZU03594.1 protoporphyrin IX magnesium chelatase [Glycocaulis alkaliphilus]GGB82411.1 hypothetical protein GCM10007417_22950 [Glycocaulis alkaliphilus]
MIRRIVWAGGGAIVLAGLLAGAWFALQAYVLPTRVVLVNYPGFTAARIASEAEGQWVRVESVPLESVESGRGAALVVVFGRGVSLDAGQQRALRSMARSGSAVYVEAPTDPNTDVTSVTGERLDRIGAYLAFGGGPNYRNLLAYARRELDGKSIAAAEAGPPQPIPRDVLFVRDSDEVFESVEAFRAREGARPAREPAGRRLALVTSVPGPFNANRDHIDAIISVFEERGHEVYPLASATRRLDFLREIDPAAVIYMPHGALTIDQRDEAIAWLAENDIPLLTPVSVFELHDDWIDDPRGLSGSLLSMNVVLSELDGGVAPFATVAQFPGEDGLAIFEAVPDRLARFAERVERYLTLKDQDNADKRVAIFFLKGPGEGAMSAANMEVAPSLHNLLLAMREAGYDLGDLPGDPAVFEAMVMSQAPVLGSYAAGDMARWLAEDASEWVEAADYARWCEELLGAVMCARVDAEHGPAPGRYMVSRDRSALAVAAVRFGNVVILPQPLPGIGEDEYRLIHGAETAPPHPYVNAYLWAREGFGADALIHFGTHGSLEFTPGKQVALSGRDWPDALIGDLPHAYVYTMNNVGEAIIAKRRVYAAILSHLTPPFSESGLTDELGALQRALDGLRRAEGATRAERESEVRELAGRLELTGALALPVDGPWSDRDLLTLANFVEGQETARITLGLYTLGAGYPGDRLAETARQIAAPALAAALLELDRSRGLDVSGAEADETLFRARYRTRADAAVDAVIGGADPAGEIARIVSSDERARAVELAAAMAGPGEGALVRGFIGLGGPRGRGAPQEETRGVERATLLALLAPVMADPDKRELVESWRSEQQLSRALDGLDPERRARAETVARAIPAMARALRLTAEPDMRALLEALRTPDTQAEFRRLLDHPALEAEIVSARQERLADVGAAALDPERRTWLERAQADDFANTLTGLDDAVLSEVETALAFYVRTGDLEAGLRAAGADTQTRRAVLSGREAASSALREIASERRTREGRDRAFIDAVGRIERLITAIPDTLDALARSGDLEIRQILRALDGGYIEPSVGGDPIISPAALPTGRNMVSIDAERTPSEAAWRVGGQLADRLIERHLDLHGAYPEKVAFTLWPGDFIQTEGATIAQILHLLGVEPVRDPFGRVNDIRLVPQSELGRPRVDVVVQTAGQIRDLAASRLELIQKAVAMAAADGANPVSRSTEAVERALLAEGLSPLEARRLATSRIFGGVNGNYGTAIMGLVESGSQWEEAGEIGRQYLRNMNARYGDAEGWGADTPGLFAAALQGTDVIIQPRESNVNGPLSLDHFYEFMGGLSRAVETATGREADAYFNDFRTPGAARVETLESAIAEELFGTLLNPRYIAAMQEGGASSAAVFAETFRNAYGWEAMRPAAIQEGTWDRFYDVYVDDSLEMGVREFFERAHPQSLQEMTAVMLETARKGMWDAAPERIEALAVLHAELIETHGAGCSGFVCGNPQLRDYIESHLSEAAAPRYREALDTATRDPGAASALVLSERERRAPETGGAPPQRRQGGDDQGNDATLPLAAMAAAGGALALAIALGLLALRRRRTG